MVTAQATWLLVGPWCNSEWCRCWQTRQVVGDPQFSTLWDVDKQFVHAPTWIMAWRRALGSICWTRLHALRLCFPRWQTLQLSSLWTDWWQSVAVGWALIVSSMQACRSTNVSTLLNVWISVNASAIFSRAASDCWSSFLLIRKHRTGSQDFVLISRFLRVLIEFFIVSCKALSWREEPSMEY